MSTNFYLRTPQTPEGDEGLHIGLRSMGWPFLFQAHTEPKIESVATWMELFATGTIVDEYGTSYSATEFMMMVAWLKAKCTRWWEEEGSHVSPGSTRFRDERGYSFDRRNFS